MSCLLYNQSFGIRRNMSNPLTSYVLSMQAKDLQQWADTPEEFHHECETSAWEEHLRSCAQVLLGVLMEVGVTWPCQGACELPYSWHAAHAEGTC